MGNETYTGFYSTIYPEDVRYALKHRDGKLTAEEVSCLANRFPTEAMYITARFLNNHDPQRFLDYSNQLLHLAQDTNSFQSGLKSIIDSQLDLLPSNSLLPALKINQISRMSLPAFQEQFVTKISEAFMNEPYPDIICPIATATFLGFDQIVSNSHNRPIFFIFPQKDNQLSSEFNGIYTPHPQSEFHLVTSANSPDLFEKQILLLDDTEKTGKTKKAATDQLVNLGADPDNIFFTAAVTVKPDSI